MENATKFTAAARMQEITNKMRENIYVFRLIAPLVGLFWH